MDPRPALHLAARQAGCVSYRQLVALGLPSSSIQRLPDHGWHRPGRGVFATPGSDPGSPPARRWCAVLRVGPPCWIAGTSALAVHGLTDRTEGRDTVLVRRDRSPVVPSGLRVLRRDVEVHEVTEVVGLPVTTPSRTLRDVAADLPEHRLLGVTATALQRGEVSLEALSVVRGFPGAARLRTVARELAATGAESPLAHRVTVLLRAHGIVTHAEVRVGARAGGPAVLDLVVAGTRVAVEIDGHRHHSSRAALARDRRRQNRLLAAGWVVLRVDHDRLVRDPGGFVAEVRAAVDRDRCRR